MSNPAMFLYAKIEIINNLVSHLPDTKYFLELLAEYPMLLDKETQKYLEPARTEFESFVDNIEEDIDTSNPTSIWNTVINLLGVDCCPFCIENILYDDEGQRVGLNCKECKYAHEKGRCGAMYSNYQKLLALAERKLKEAKQNVFNTKVQ